MVHRESHQCGGSIFQQGEYSYWAAATVPDGSGSASSLAEDFDGKFEAQFRFAARHWDCCGAVAFALGFREFYSLVCLILCVFVASTIALEFYRGAKVIRARSGASLFTSAVVLTMRNTRRY